MNAVVVVFHDVKDDKLGNYQIEKGLEGRNKQYAARAASEICHIEYKTNGGTDHLLICPDVDPSLGTENEIERVVKAAGASRKALVLHEKEGSTKRGHQLALRGAGESLQGATVHVYSHDDSNSVYKCIVGMLARECTNLRDSLSGLGEMQTFSGRTWHLRSRIGNALQVLDLTLWAWADLGFDVAAGNRFFEHVWGKALSARGQVFYLLYKDDREPEYDSLQTVTHECGLASSAEWEKVKRLFPNPHESEAEGEGGQASFFNLWDSQNAFEALEEAESLVAGDVTRADYKAQIQAFHKWFIDLMDTLDGLVKRVSREESRRPVNP